MEKVEKKEELTDIFESMKLDTEIFTEEVMDRVKLVIESKVAEKLEVEKQQLEESNKVELSEFKDGLIENLDNYMNYFVEEFTQENEKDIIDSVKVKTAERVLENFNKIVNDFNISLSEDTVDQTDKISELEAELNDSINESIKMKQELAESNKYAMIIDKTMKIEVESEKSKFSKLAESFEYTDDESFEAKLNTLQESLEITITEEDESGEGNLIEQEKVTEDKILTESKTVQSSKKQYLNVLHRTA